MYVGTRNVFIYATLHWRVCNGAAVGFNARVRLTEHYDNFIIIIFLCAVIVKTSHRPADKKTGPSSVGRTHSSSAFRLRRLLLQRSVRLRLRTSRGLARPFRRRVPDTGRTPHERPTATVTRTSVPPTTSCGQKDETVRFRVRAAEPGTIH